MVARIARKWSRSVPTSRKAECSFVMLMSNHRLQNSFIMEIVTWPFQIMAVVDHQHAMAKIVWYQSQATIVHSVQEQSAPVAISIYSQLIPRKSAASPSAPEMSTWFYLRRMRADSLRLLTTTRTHWFVVYFKSISMSKSLVIARAKTYARLQTVGSSCREKNAHSQLSCWARLQTTRNA